MNVDPKQPAKPDRDRFVLSKGHCAPALYGVLALKGFFDPSEIKNLRKIGSMLQGHPDMLKIPGVDMSTGSLGQGISAAVGMALSLKLKDSSARVYCALGDGELEEGQVWEAAMAASHFGCTNLITFVDRNNCMIDGRTEDIMALEPMADKWTAFGFIVKEVDGQNLNELDDAIEFAKANTTNKPVLILCNTKKGAGIANIEDNYLWHYGAMNEDMYEQSKAELEAYHQARLARAEKEGK